MPKKKKKSRKTIKHSKSIKHSIHYDEELKSKARKNSMKDGAFFSIMDATGLKYATPYALALGANNIQIGLLSSGPQLLGTLFQLASLKSMSRFSRKQIVVFGAAMEALMWIPMIIIGALYFSGSLSQSIAIWSTIAIYAVIYVFGAIISPLWTSWTKDILPKKAGNYFGHRAKLTGFMSLLSMLMAGAILNYFENTSVFTGFMTLFLVALFARVMSTIYLSKQYEPKFVAEEGAYFSFTDFVKKMLQSNFGRYTFFIAVFMFAVSIASPFFSVFILKDLGLNYIYYTLFLIIAPLVMIIFYPFWGKFQDKYGNIKVLEMTGFFIPFIPLFYFTFSFFFKDMSYLLFPSLVFVEIMSGIAWSGFNLAMVNFIYDAVSRQRLAICVAYFHILTNIGIFFGAMIGGFITKMPTIFGFNAMYFMFIASAIARMTTYFLLVPKVHEVRQVKTFGFEEAHRKLHHIRPESLLRKFK